MLQAIPSYLTHCDCTEDHNELDMNQKAFAIMLGSGACLGPEGTRVQVLHGGGLGAQEDGRVGGGARGPLLRAPALYRPTARCVP